MKFQQIEAFERSLREAFPDHPSQVYGLAMPKKDERDWCVEKISQCIHALDPSVERVECLLEELNVSEVFSPSLFAQTKLVIVEGVEGLKKDHPLLDELSRLPEKTFVILCGTSLSIYEKVKKDIVFLDLSKEKPWERTERLRQSMHALAKESGMHLTSDASAFMMQLIPNDFAILSKELEKAICYVGSRSEIDLQAVQAVCTARPEVKGWKISEDLVWKGKKTAHPFADSSEFFSIMGQVRYHLKTGLHIAEALEANSSNFPTLRPKQLETYKQIARTLKSSYFRKGLLSLFDLELKAKSTSAPQKLLWDHFAHRLKCSRA